VIPKRKHDVVSALQSLCPKASWSMNGQELTWLSEDVPQPSQEEIEAEIARLDAIEDRQFYRLQRAAEYPSFEEYLDGVVKGDQEQVQAYIDACLAVKEKYPKPS
jgi:hypothetical protein